MKASTRLVLLGAVMAMAAAVGAAEHRVFSDDFSSADSGWTHAPVADHNAKGISLYDDNGGYQMTPLDNVTYGVALAPAQAASANVHAQSDLFLYTGVGAGTAGLICRYSRGNFYGFMVTGAHEYAIIRVQNDVPTQLASGSFEGMMPNVADVTISARCNGSQLQMALGGEVVAEAQDSEFSSGASGLVVVGEKMAGTSAVFDNFALSELVGK